MKALEKILFVIIMIVMLLPAIQREFKIMPDKKLQGDFKLADKPVFSWESWNEGVFQTDFDKWLEDHIGFRNFFVRINNQIDFSLFSEVHADGVVLGKENVLYEFDYIREYTGNDFVGYYLIDKRIRQLTFLQKHLKENFDIDLVLVFEPGKANYLPEFIPDQYLINKKSPTNFQVYKNTAENYKTNFINWNDWYINSIKPLANYPVYTKYGIHWSEYGMTFALDSMISFIENTRHIDLREMIIDSLAIEDCSRTPDYDIGAALNLMFRLPEHEKFAYPAYKFGPTEGKDFPMVLVAGDSYYWNIFNSGIARELFKNQAFWYFNNLVYPDTYSDTTTVNDLNLKEEIEKQDVIFLMVTGRFLYKFDWGFVNKLYDIYGIKSKYDKVYDIMNGITAYSVWFDNMVRQAEDNAIPLSEVLTLNARYIYETDNLEDYLILRGQEHFEEKIRHDSNWMLSVRKKAIENNISEKEMIQREATYMFQSDHPDSFEKHQKLRQFKAEIKDDPIRYKELQIKASYYFLTVDEMLQIEAEKMLDKNE
ncbi:MAG: hypothetical protein R2759_05790 [Bacteroidales bacterium]